MKNRDKSAEELPIPVPETRHETDLLHLLGRNIRLPDQPLRFAPAPVAGSPEWRDLPEQVRLRLIERGDAALMADIPHLLASDLTRFSRDGDRAGFEAKYFARRRHLNALAMAALAGDPAPYLSPLADMTLLLCEESGWQLPAHNAQQRGGARAPLPDPYQPIVDLFAAETGAQLGVLCAVLGPQIASVAPGLTERILREVHHRILTPYLEQKFWWMGNVDGPTNNWTVWITQNILLCALSLPTDDSLRRAVIRRAISSLDAFLSDYGDDGACEEGPLYYRHAGLCLWGILDILSQVAPEAFAEILTHPKIRNIAEYIEAVHVSGRTFINFADSPAINPPCTLREVLFGRATGSQRLERFALNDAASAGWDDLPNEINLWYRLLQAQHSGELSEVLPQPLPPRDIWYPSIGLMVARGAGTTLAVKAGGNGDSHNHNDTGSVTLYREGRPVLIDIGVGIYTKKTFSPERYDIWTMQSSWHNLPDFAEQMQHDGAAFASRDVHPDLQEDHAALSMELADAWHASAGLRRFHRKVRLDKTTGRVEIRDIYDSDGPAVLNLIFAIAPRISGTEIALPNLAHINCDGASGVSLEAIQIEDTRLRESWPETLWRTRITAAANQLTITIS